MKNGIWFRSHHRSDGQHDRSTDLVQLPWGKGWEGGGRNWAEES